MPSEVQKTPYSIQEIKLGHGTEYFFVLEEVDLFTIFRIDRACAQRLETFLHHIALDPQRTEESLLLLVELNKISTPEFLVLLAKSRCSRLCQETFTSTSSRLRGFYRIRKTRGKRPLVRAKLLGIRGSDLAAAVCSENISHCSRSVLQDEHRPCPNRWSAKHDHLLLLANMPYDLERFKQYLEFHQLLVCSSEWLEKRREELLADRKYKDFLAIPMDVGS